MALNHDELALRDALDDLVRDQPEAPAGRYAAVRGRVVRHRIRQTWAGVGALAVAAALVAIAVALPHRLTGSPASSRPVPSWALPWPDHRDGSVPRRVLDGAITAWRHESGSFGRVLGQPAKVIWYVGQSAAAGQEIVVVFEVDGPTGHRLVAGIAAAGEVMRGQSGWAGGGGPWALADIPAPSPGNAGLAIGLNMSGLVGPAAGRGPDNWIMVLAGPQVRRLAWTAVTTGGTQAASASTSRGLLVADTGQVMRPVRLTGLITRAGNVLRHAGNVGLPAAGNSQVPQSGPPALPVLALPAALRLPKSFQVVEGIGATGPGSINGTVPGDFKPAQREIIIARCYGPGQLKIRLMHGQGELSQDVLGVIRCDNAQHELQVPADQVLTHNGVNVQAGELTSYWLDFGIVP